jgi:hypothetical protein
MKAPLPKPKRTTVKGRRQQRDAIKADEKLTRPDLILLKFIFVSTTISPNQTYLKFSVEFEFRESDKR